MQSKAQIAYEISVLFHDKIQVVVLDYLRNHEIPLSSFRGDEFYVKAVISGGEKICDDSGEINVTGMFEGVEILLNKDEIKAMQAEGITCRLASEMEVVQANAIGYRLNLGKLIELTRARIPGGRHLGVKEPVTA